MWLASRLYKMYHNIYNSIKLINNKTVALFIVVVDDIGCNLLISGPAGGVGDESNVDCKFNRTMPYDDSSSVNKQIAIVIENNHQNYLFLFRFLYFVSSLFLSFMLSLSLSLYLLKTYGSILMGDKK